MTFYEWIAAFKTYKAPIGDLAKAILADEQCRSLANERPVWHAHFERVEAEPATIRALHSAWSRYEAERKKLHA